MPKSNAVLAPTLGLYLDRPAVEMDPRMLQDGLNFRVRDGKLSNLNLGWTRFGEFVLDGPVSLIDNFISRGVGEQLIFADLRNIYLFDDPDVVYLNPIYATGTAACADDEVTGTGTSWTANVKEGDFISFGSATENDPLVDWFEITGVTDNDTLIIDGTATEVDGPYTIRITFTGDFQDHWVTEKFLDDGVSGDDLWFATNGIDPVVTWNGDDDTVTLQDALGFTCKSLVRFSNMMIYMNLSQLGESKPTDIINSNVGEPLNVSSGLSEQFKIHAGHEEILGGRRIGDNLAIYCRDPIVMAQFVGDPLVFVFRVAVEARGPLSGRSILTFPDYHQFMGRDALYVFDGATAKPTDSHIWRTLLRQRDPVREPNIYTHIDYENGDVIWSVPITSDPLAGEETGPPVKAFVGHYLEGGLSSTAPTTPTPYSARSLPFTATGYFTREAGIRWDALTDVWESYSFRWTDNFFAASFPLNLGGDIDGKVYSLNDSQNADGAALISFVQFGRRPTVDGRMRGLLTRVYPFLSSFSTPITITVSFSDQAYTPSTTDEMVSFDQSAPEGGHFAVIYRRGRYFELQFGTAGPSAPWEIAGYDPEFRPGGRR